MKVKSYMIRLTINHFKENSKKNCKECEKQTEKDLLRKWQRCWTCYIAEICESF